MVGRVKRAAKELLGSTAPGRGAEIYPDDVLIVSYPKSGNTWTRFLIGNLAYKNDSLTFANVEQRVPSIYLNHEVLRNASRPRMLKSHEYFDPRYKKVIYVVRDPRDVAVSYYHFHIKVRVVGDGYPMMEYVPRFLSGELDPFGTWAENVGSWLGARANDPGFLLLRYEDMLQDPVGELRKVASFLAVDATIAELENVVWLSSADQMRKLEKEHVWEAIKKSRKDRAFVRSARAGSWKEELPESSVNEIEAKWNALMKKLGYELGKGSRVDEV